MNMDMRIRNFNKRWNITVDDATVFKDFKNRVLGTVDKCLGVFFLRNSDASELFKRMIGYHDGAKSTYIQADRISSQQLALQEMTQQLRDVTRPEVKTSRFSEHLVYITFTKAENLQQLIRYIQIVFWILENDVAQSNSFFLGMKEAIDYSQLGIRIARSGTRITLYPAGASELDEKLVNDNLLWLEDYPKTRQSFAQALEMFMSRDKVNYRNLLDNLRTSLEIFLRKVLGNRKPLEKQKEDIARWLTSNGVRQGTANIYCNLLDAFALFQNEHVKHAREVDKAKAEEFIPEEMEFMIYLTGTFMRLVLTVKQRVGTNVV